MIRTSVEGARGCGYRKEGGLYLVSPVLSEPCPRLPLPLDRCPCCGQGIGPARGFTWIRPSKIAPASTHGSDIHNAVCPLGATRFSAMAQYHRTGERAGLIWVGEKFYPTPEKFMEEAARMGVSRRIKAVPRDFVVGETWVYFGHRKAIPIRVIDEAEAKSFEALPDGTFGLNAYIKSEHTDYSPGIITLFRPTAIEYVVKGTETDEEIEALEKRGINPVKVIRDIDVES